MIAVAHSKIKYNGQIRRAETPFLANDSDRELLESWGCSILDECKPQKKPSEQVQECKPADVEQVQELVQEQPKTPKKTRKRAKV